MVSKENWMEVCPAKWKPFLFLPKEKAPIRVCDICTYREGGREPSLVAPTGRRLAKGGNLHACCTSAHMSTFSCTRRKRRKRSFFCPCQSRCLPSSLFFHPTPKKYWVPASLPARPVLPLPACLRLHLCPCMRCWKKEEEEEEKEEEEEEEEEEDEDAIRGKWPERKNVIRDWTASLPSFLPSSSFQPPLPPPPPNLSLSFSLSPLSLPHSLLLRNARGGWTLHGQKRTEKVEQNWSLSSPFFLSPPPPPQQDQLARVVCVCV